MNKLVAIHYSEYFQINHKEFERLGVYDGFVNADSVLHIHPLLIRTTHIPEFCDAYQEFLLHFNNVQHLVRCQINGKAYDKCERALKSLLTFKELPNTGLGYSKGRTGTGISGHLTNVLYQSAREIIEAGISDSNMFILLPLIEDQIGADRISDMTISILRKRFYSYTARVAKELNISCACYQEEQERYLLPMIERKPVVFMPCEFLQELPVAESLQDVGKVCKYNQELRNIICREISITFKEYDQYNKNKIKKIVLGNSQLTQSLLNYLKTVTLKPYDFKKDEIGEYVFSRIDEQIWSKNLITLPLPTTENVLDITIQICQQYKTLIENNRFYSLLFNEDGSPKHESASQFLFYCIALSYCTTNNIDVNRESNPGCGALDFKLSRGCSCKVVVEIKLTSNPNALRGYSQQLIKYMQTENTDKGVFILIKVGTKNDDKIVQRLLQLKEQLDMENKPEIVIIDARVTPSASKL